MEGDLTGHSPAGVEAEVPAAFGLTRETARDLARKRIAVWELENDIEVEDDAAVELASDGSFAYVTVNLFVKP